MALDMLEMAGIEKPNKHGLWHNKVAYVIVVDGCHGILAVYKHDFGYWLIKRAHR